MQACSNYTQTNHLDYSVEQLRLPLDLSVAIDKYDPLWSFLEVIKEVNLKKYLKPHRGNQGHNSLMMMKVVLFAYMNQVYSLRQMEERCRNDIRFLYLSEEERPSHMAFQRFINNQLKGNISDIFTEITETIFEKTNADTRILYLDGTMMEANANKFTFVWKKTAEKSLAKSICRIKESNALLESETGLKYGMPLPLVSEWLGHAQINTTREFYANADVGMKGKAIEQATSKLNPLFKAGCKYDFEVTTNY